jgi:hypothetical protein
LQAQLTTSLEILQLAAGIMLIALALFLTSRTSHPVKRTRDKPRCRSHPARRRLRDDRRYGRDGRRIFNNLRRAFRYLNAFHAPLLLSALLVPLVGAPLFLLPVHLVWLELIVHPTSALVFENDPAAPGLMRRAPRLRNAGLLQACDWARPLGWASRSPSASSCSICGLCTPAPLPKLRALSPWPRDALGADEPRPHGAHAGAVETARSIRTRSGNLKLNP